MRSSSSSSLLALGLLLGGEAVAQELAPAPAPRPEPQVRQHGHDRPALLSGRWATIGGYAEANVAYVGEDGVDEGPSFEFRRFNLFVFSQILPWIRFFSELEFEHGTEEIVLETAQVDFELVPEFIVRAGILLPPIGAFNQDHDAPNWDFVDRPFVSTMIIPSTLSEVGIGPLGHIELGDFTLSYQAYLTQGLGGGIVDGPRTDISNGRDPALFEEDNNGSPAISARIGLEHRHFEVGVSNYSGLYNTFRVEGERIDRKRAVTITAVDGALELGRVSLWGELAVATVDVPRPLEGPLGERQIGFAFDTIVEVYDFRLLSTRVGVDAAARLDYVDFNVGRLSTGDRAGDEISRLTVGAAMRPGEQTVVRLNYYQERTTDLLGNPPARGAGLQLGLATFF